MLNLPNTLSFRLTRAYAVTFSLFFVAALITSWWMLHRALDLQTEESLIADIREFSTLFDSGGMPRVIEEIQLELSENGAKRSCFLIVNSQRQTIYSSDLSHWQSAQISAEAMQKVQSQANLILANNRLESDGEAAKGAFGKIGPDHYLQIGESTEETAEILETVTTIFLLVFMLTIPIATWIGWKISQRAVRGVREVTYAVGELRSGHFKQKVNIQAQDDEIQALVSAFNAMAERIHSLMSEMHEMIDNIAHDLRSPLARIRLLAESVGTAQQDPERNQAVGNDILNECDQLLKLINNTLDVAEAEAEINHKDLVMVDFADLTEEICELYQPLAEQKQINFINTIDQAYSLIGQKQNLRRMLANLIDNALKYTPAKGFVKVHLKRHPIALKGIVLEVTDSGIGIPKHDLPLVFNRFYRCDNSRAKQGCGLGLSFAAAVAKAHGGKIEVQSEPEIGSTFTLYLC